MSSITTAYKLMYYLLTLVSLANAQSGVPQQRENKKKLAQDAALAFKAAELYMLHMLCEYVNRERNYSREKEPYTPFAYLKAHAWLSHLYR